MAFCLAIGYRQIVFGLQQSFVIFNYWLTIGYMMKQTILFCAFLWILKSHLSAQVNDVYLSEHGHKLTLVIAHAHLSKGINMSTGNQQWIILPAWCFDYDYVINPKWQIGL